MTPLERMRAYRDSLKRAGRMLEARAVARCMEFAAAGLPARGDGIKPR